MSALWLAGYSLIIFLCGLSLAPELRRRAGAIVLLGGGAMGTLLFWLSLLGIRPARAAILLIGCAATSIVLARSVRRLRIPMIRFKVPRAAIIATLVLAMPVLLVTIHATAYRTFDWDAFSIFGLKAKVLLLSALRPEPAYFSDASYSFSHLNYPLLCSFLEAGAFAMLGEIDDSPGRIAFALIYAGGVAMTYAEARRRSIDRAPSALLVLTFLATPVMLVWAGAGTADVPLVCFQLGALFSLARWLESFRRIDALHAALFLSFAVFTKNEGSAVAAVDLIALSILVALRCSRQKAIGVAGIVIGMLLIAGPWLIWRRHLPATDENYAGHLTPDQIAQHHDRAGTILHAYAIAPLRRLAWGVSWFIPLVCALLGFSGWRRPAAQLGWLVLIGQLAVYFLIYLITPWDLRELLPITLDRLLLHVAPAAVLITLGHWPGHIVCDDRADRNTSPLAEDPGR